MALVVLSLKSMYEWMYLCFYKFFFIIFSNLHKALISCSTNNQPLIPSFFISREDNYFLPIYREDYYLSSLFTGRIITYPPCDP